MLPFRLRPTLRAARYPGASGGRPCSDLASLSPRRAGRACVARSRKRRDLPLPVASIGPCPTPFIFEARPAPDGQVTAPFGTAADERARSTAPQGREGRRPWRPPHRLV